MKISIVVPAFNEQKVIRRSVQAMAHAAAAFTQRGWQHEIIVCDNNSTDDTAALARAEGATVVFEPVNQISRARNRGASIATGDWLVFVDADSFPTKELFADVAELIEKGDCIGGGVVVKLEHGQGMLRVLTGAWNLLSRWKRWMAGSFIFCELRSFRELGGFSHELFAAEELEFSKRLQRLAKTQKRRIVILHRHPLLTSARKAHLYSRAEHLKFIARTVFKLGRPLKKREECPLWYDGRR